MISSFVITIEHELEGTYHDFKLGVERAALECSAKITSFEDVDLMSAEEVLAIEEATPEIPSEPLFTTAPVVEQPTFKGADAPAQSEPKPQESVI